MSHVANLFGDFVSECMNMHQNPNPSLTPKSACMYGLPYEITLEDIEPYLTQCGLKVTLCFKDLKQKKALKKKYPQFEYTSPRQANHYDAELIVVLGYLEMDGPLQRSCHRICDMKKTWRSGVGYTQVQGQNTQAVTVIVS